MRRRIIQGVVAVAAAGALAGCGSSSHPTSSSTTTSPATGGGSSGTTATTSSGSSGAGTGTTGTGGSATTSPTTAGGSSGSGGSGSTYVAPSGPSAATALAAKIGCTGVALDSHPKADSHASSAAQCTFGSDKLLLAVFPDSTARDEGLKALSASLGSTKIVGAEGSNWAVIGASANASSASLPVAEEIQHKLGGTIFHG